MDDLITKRQAVERMNDLMVIELKMTRPPTWNEVYNAIKELPSAQQWIPCFERLPEEDGLEVLFSSRFGRVHIGKYHDDASLNRWFSYRDKIRLMNDEVTAWMPLPEPYEG